MTSAGRCTIFLLSPAYCGGRRAAMLMKPGASSPLAVRLAKEAINRAFETPLSDGIAHERRSFYLLFATEDQKEGMAAFGEKRAPAWKGK